MIGPFEADKSSFKHQSIEAKQNANVFVTCPVLAAAVGIVRRLLKKGIGSSSS
jgi:hypothetical protein